MKNGRHQAKDISDADALAAIETVQREMGANSLWAGIAELSKQTFAEVLAAARSEDA